MKTTYDLTGGGGEGDGARSVTAAVEQGWRRLSHTLSLFLIDDGREGTSS